MLLRLGLEVGNIDIATIIAGDCDDLQTGHDRGSGIGAVSRNGNEADVAMRLAARLMVAADSEQARIFTLAAGIGLKRYGIEAGDLGQHRLELLEELLISLRLLERGKGMDHGEVAPGDGNHLRRGIEL